MNVASLQQSGSNLLTGTLGGSASNSEDVTEETFLKLLSTQLQHQDPLSPADNVEFIQQLTQFSMLEQQRITNQNLLTQQLYASAINNSNALSLVGKEVKISNNNLSHSRPGQAHDFLYESDSDASKLHIRVLDARGQEVYHYQQVGAADGEQSFTWNGQDNQGNMLPAGEYKIRVSLEDEAGEEFGSRVYQTQQIKGLSYENGGIQVIVGEGRIPIENVVEVYGLGQSSEPEAAAAQNDAVLKNIYPFKAIAGGR